MICTISDANLYTVAMGRHAPREPPGVPEPRCLFFRAGVNCPVRLIAQQITDATGQQVIVENRAGAAQNIAAKYVAKSPNDGYTLFLSSAALASGEVDFSFNNIPSAQPMLTPGRIRALGNSREGVEGKAGIALASIKAVQRER